MKDVIKVEELDCIGCGCCVIHCPMDVIIPSPRFIPEIDKEKCNNCLFS